MIEILATIRINRKNYLVPFHPQYESQRLQNIQAHLLPLMDFLKNELNQDGSIFITWDDDKERPNNKLALNTGGNVDLLQVIEKVNEYSETFNWSKDLP